ncbi:MAG: arginine--tRNA ligase [Candidatus Parcubacteria bacterium]|nr:arginine--tRNA ligase [Candidatus Parcubacteria bacterium]
MNKDELLGLVKKAVLIAQKEGKLPCFDIPEISINYSEKEEYGDYNAPIAFSIAKIINQSPKSIADTLTNILKQSKEIELVESKDGFINFYFSDKELQNCLNDVFIKKDKYGSSDDGKNNIMVIDYSAPNIAKPFGIGHLRSTIIGQAIYNLYKFSGWKCIGDNHLGDWGTQFGKLIVAIKKWNKKPIKDLSISELQDLYIKFHSETEHQPELLEEARKWFKKLEQGDKEAKNIWKICVDISLKEFDRVYKLLGVKIDKALGESFYEDKMASIIEDAKEKSIAKKSQNALVIFLSGIETPLMLLKSDGATTYETRDLATIKYRMDKWKPNLIIYEVGADQKLHFEKVFKTAEMLGYKDNVEFKHIAHGLIRWEDRKFSTRKGDTIALEDVLNEAIKRAEEIILKPRDNKEISFSQKKNIAKEVGIGAVKYNDLSRHPEKDIVFDLDRIVTLEGNSGPYIQYTAVRCQSVLDKVKKFDKKVKITSLNSEERAIIRLIKIFPETAEGAVKSFSPNLICSFLFELAQKYNIFYEKHIILNTEDKEVRDFRLALTFTTRQVLKNGLGLLGISIPKQM